MEHTVPSIIDEMEQYKPIAYATTGQRFINMLIDTLFYYTVSMVVGGVLDVLTTLLGVDLISIFSSRELGDILISMLINCLIMFAAYFFFEGLSKGLTLGKLITGTRAVKEDNSSITWKDAALRSITRLIPFEPFSAFSGNGMWHDRLSKTMVVKTRGV
jgi:uncharacterized RDD family membrane protein YckC